MNTIGIMQGRLSPPAAGRIQSFPVETWRQEFLLARQAGIAFMEWVYQADTERVNPLNVDGRMADIHEVVAGSGVTVGSVSADYYMTHRLVAEDGNVVWPVAEHLRSLLKRAKSLGVRYVMVPFVDAARLVTDAEMNGLVDLLSWVKSILDEAGEIELHMETDLPAADWAGILRHAAHPRIKVCYDTGDRASKGYDPAEDFKFLSPWLGSVHIKDRTRGGGSVPLGAGAVNFPACFELIHAASYRGTFTLQTARETRISELELAVWNRQFVQTYLSKLPAETTP